MSQLPVLVILIPFFVLGVTESLKVLTKSIEEKRFAWKSFFRSGGMPSGHSAFTSSIATIVGLTTGIQSVEFLIATGFAIIVMYDARGVRNAVSKHAKIINEIKQSDLDESVGHTNLQVIVGCAVGIILSIVFFKLT